MIATLVRLNYQVRATRFTRTNNNWTRPEPRRVTKVVIQNEEVEFTWENQVLTLTTAPVDCYLTKEAYVSNTPLQIAIPGTSYVVEFKPVLGRFKGSVEELSDEITGEALQTEITVEFETTADLLFARLNNQRVNVWEYDTDSGQSREVFRGNVKSASTQQGQTTLKIRNRIGELQSEYLLKNTDEFPRAESQLVPEYFGSVRNAKAINIQKNPVVIRQQITISLLSQIIDENEMFYRADGDPYQYRLETELDILEDDTVYKITEDEKEEIDFEFNFEATSGITVLSFAQRQPSEITIEHEQNSIFHLNKNLMWILSGNEQRDIEFTPTIGRFGFDIGSNNIEIGDVLDWTVPHPVHPLAFPAQPRSGVVSNKILNSIDFPSGQRPSGDITFKGIRNVRLGGRPLPVENFEIRWDRFQFLEINRLEAGNRMEARFFALYSNGVARTPANTNIEAGDYFTLQASNQPAIKPSDLGTTRFIVLQVGEREFDGNPYKFFRFRPLDENPDNPAHFSYLRIQKTLIPKDSDELEFDCNNGVLENIVRTPADFIKEIIPDTDDDSFDHQELGRISYALKTNKKRAQIVSEMNKSCNGLLYLNNNFEFKHRLFEMQTPKVILDELNLFRISSRGKTNDINQLVANGNVVVTQQTAGDQIKTENQNIHLFFENDVIEIANQSLFYRSEFSTAFSFVHSGFLQVELGDTAAIRTTSLKSDYGLGLIFGVITRILKLNGMTELTINTAGQKGLRLATIQNETAQNASLENIAQQSHIVDNITESPLESENYSGIGVLG